jgi:hypothetical protein
MAPKLTIKKDYILVEPQENEYWEIWEAVGRLLKMPEYPDKNDIWVFHDGPIKLSYEAMYKLRDLIKEHYPENATRSKTAIVLATKLGLQMALAKSFALIASDLPYEIRIFTNLGSAEDWISS